SAQSGAESTTPSHFIVPMRSRKIRWIAATTIVVAAIIFASVIRFRSGSNSVEASAPAPIVPDQPRQVVSESAGPQAQPTVNNPVQVQTPPVSASVVLTRSLPLPASSVARASSSVTLPDSTQPGPPAPPAASSTGFLALSSLTSVEIY